MWSRLREVFARELVVLVDPTNPRHARRRKQLTASVGAILRAASYSATAPAVLMSSTRLRRTFSRRGRSDRSWPLPVDRRHRGERRSGMLDHLRVTEQGMLDDVLVDDEAGNRDHATFV